MPSTIRVPITVRRSPEERPQTTEEAPAPEAPSGPSRASRSDPQPNSAAQTGHPQEPVTSQRDTTLLTESAIERALDGSELLEEAKLQAFVLSLLEIGDNLERALAFAQQGDPVAQGIRLTWQQFLRALAQVDIQPIDSIHQPFDPHRHEALAVVASELPEGTVVREEQRGYLYRQELLRPARVVVSTGPKLDSEARE